MKVLVKSDGAQIGGAVPVCLAFENAGKLKSVNGAAAKDASVRRLAEAAGFTGSFQQTLFAPHRDGWMLLVGAGNEAGFTRERLRRASAAAANALNSRKFVAGALALPDSLADEKAIDGIAQVAAEGALLSRYAYARYKSDKPLPGLRQFILRVSGAKEAKARGGAQTGAVIAEGVAFARDLINGPPNLVTPAYLAAEARRMARAEKLRCTVLSMKQLEEKGFGGIVAVGKGSAHPPQFIVLEHRPARPRATLALVGKGVTFDTGGINLKPSQKMELMKYDMSGAAAVLAAVTTAARLRSPLRVIAIVAATENMPSGNAQKPSDIYTSLSGKTVEVLNTDAEGRLILADCLHYAKRFDPDAVIDIATLTGACSVALGGEAIGLMANDDALAGRIEAAGNRAHERVWRLPLWDEYGEALKSDIADIQNISKTGEAGTIVAGKFLQAFVGEMRWAHLDIAGTAWSERAKPYAPKGGAGIGVRLLVDLIRNWS